MNIKKIRDRAWLYLNPCVAAVAKMTVPDMQQFIAGAYDPTDEQLAALARRMGFDEKEIA